MVGLFSWTSHSCCYLQPCLFSYLILSESRYLLCLGVWIWLVGMKEKQVKYRSLRFHTQYVHFLKLFFLY